MPFDRVDLRSVAEDGKGDARARRLTVDQQRAGAAGALFAAQVCGGQIELLAQKIRKMHAWLDALGNRGRH